jgi:hypothetical protein
MSQRQLKAQGKDKFRSLVDPGQRGYNGSPPTPKNGMVTADTATDDAVLPQALLGDRDWRVLHFSRPFPDTNTQTQKQNHTQIPCACKSPLEKTMEADISIWRKTGHFYFALTRICQRSKK